MKQNLVLIATMVLAITISLSVDGKRLRLRPMSGSEVYQALREAGREDAIPEGRVITQGLAAIKGFALGISSGVGGSLLFDLVTANATTNFLSGFNYSALVPNFNAINYTALLPPYNLTALFPNVNFTGLFGVKAGLPTNGTITFTQQEICFNTRSLNAIDDDGEVVEEQGQFRQDTTSPTSPTMGPPTTSAPTFAPTTTTGTNTVPATTTVAGTTTAPTTTTVPGTTATTTTSQETPPAINCIVLQKPAAAAAG